MAREDSFTGLFIKLAASTGSKPQDFAMPIPENRKPSSGSIMQLLSESCLMYPISGEKTILTRKQADVPRNSLIHKEYLLSKLIPASPSPRSIKSTKSVRQADENAIGDALPELSHDHDTSVTPEESLNFGTPCIVYRQSRRFFDLRTYWATRP